MLRDDLEGRDGRENQREGIYVYIYPIHCAVH